MSVPGHGGSMGDFGRKHWAFHGEEKDYKGITMGGLSKTWGIDGLLKGIKPMRPLAGGKVSDFSWDTFSDMTMTPR